MKRPYSEHDIAAAGWYSAAVLAVVVASVAAILIGGPL